MDAPDTSAAAVLDRLRAEADPGYLADLSGRYGIPNQNALGVRVKTLHQIAKPLRPDHDLAANLWASGVYEARLLAAFVDDPAAVTRAQMDAWCADFDSWAVVDTLCSYLFDRAPHAWDVVRPWAEDEREFVRRAGFAMLWSLARHDTTAPDERFVSCLDLVEAHAGDPRPLVGKAQIMALRAITHKREALRPDILALAKRLVASDDRNARRVGRPIVKDLDTGESSQ